MGVIFFFSSLSIPLSFSIGEYDKTVHAGVYSGLAYFVYQAFRNSGLIRNIFSVSMVLVVLFGISDEIHQLFVPGRIASFGDVIADGFGGFAGCTFAYLANSLIFGYKQVS